MTTCQSCDNTSLTHILSLGPLPPCNDMRPIGEPAKAQEWMPTDLMYCSRCELVQLEYIGDPRVVFPASYPYTSGSTKLLRDNFKDLARECYSLFDLGPNDLIVDIGSNDGTLLSNFRKSKIIGVEPTDIADIANRINGQNVPTYKRFFNSDTARMILGLDGKAKLITCANCFAHMKDIHDVIDGVLELLAPDGVFVTESHYLIDLIDRLQYDTIYHEHLRYYSLTSLRNLLEQHGLHIFRATKISTHGGSMRVYAKRNYSQSAVLDPYLTTEPTGNKLLAKLNQFANDVVISKLSLLSEIEDIKICAHNLCGISAPSRASTVINYCRLEGLIDFVGEVEGSLKVGKYMPGTNIPVMYEDKLFGSYQPEAAVLFSWHLADELIPKLKAKGYRGKIIMPCERAKTEPSPVLRQQA